MTAKKWPTRNELDVWWDGFIAKHGLPPNPHDTAAYLKSHAAPEVPGEVREVLEEIARTDIVCAETGPTADWLCQWRNRTKERARQALKSLEGCREAVGEDEIEKAFNKLEETHKGVPRRDYFYAGFKAALEGGSK